MKKTLIILIIVMAASLGIAPYFIGQKAESELRSAITQIEENSVYQIEILSYDRGWFQSDATVNVSFALPESDDFDALPEISLKTVTHAMHGPILKEGGLGLASWTSRILDDEKAREIFDWDAATDLYLSTGHISLTGDVSITESIPKLTLIPDANEFFEFLGYSSTTVIEDGVLDYEGSTKGFNMKFSDNPLATGEISINFEADFDLSRILNGELYDGNGRILFSSISAGQGQQSMMLENIAFEFESELIDEELGNLSFAYLIGQIDAGEFQLADAELRFTLENYSSEFQQRYTQLAKDMFMVDPESVTPEQAEAFINELLPALLAPGLKLNIESSASLSQGAFSSAINLALDPISTLPEDLGDAAFWLQKLKVDANLVMDSGAVDYLLAEYLGGQIEAQLESSEAAVELTPEQMNEMITQQSYIFKGMAEDQGIVVNNGDNYSFDLNYDHGKTRLNGNEFDIPVEAFFANDEETFQ